MSGLEIAGFVVAIVSAFAGTMSVWQNRSSKGKKASALERSLTRNPRHVQDEYDRHFASLGQRFARGDSIAHSTLSNIVMNMQQELLMKLIGVISGGGSDSMYASLLQTSDNARARTVSALGDQYQRLAIAAPVQAPPWQHVQEHDAYCDVCEDTIYGTRYKCANLFIIVLQLFPQQSRTT